MASPSTLSAALVLSVALCVAPAAASAQTVVRQMPALTAAAAERAVRGAEAEARKNGWAVSIAVVDPAGELIAFLRMDGAHPASVDVSRQKARTAARFRRATKVFEESLANGRTAILSLDGVTAVEGGVPVVVAGDVIGAVGVSGVTSAQDGQVAQAGITAATAAPR